MSKYIGLLKPDSQKFLIAMAKAELTPIELAAKAGISVNFVYSIRRGNYTKPKYLGACCRILNVKVEDVVESEGRPYEYTGKVDVHTTEPESTEGAV